MMVVTFSDTETGYSKTFVGTNIVATQDFITNYFDKFANAVKESADIIIDNETKILKDRTQAELRWVIKNVRFFGFPPMNFSGELANNSISRITKDDKQDKEITIETADYGVILDTEGYPPGTVIKVDSYVHEWARVKLKAGGDKPGYLLRKIIKKKGVKPRHWIDIAELNAWKKFVEEFDRYLEKELSNIMKSIMR